MLANNKSFGLEWDKPLSRKEKTLSTPILHSYRVHATVSVP